uniref:4-hydroxyphenylpyruvate dioxygenase n=1 Tax=Acrobeloides nanus TaxID=290746 RepID=A0A914EEW0_9BILA
MGEVEHFHHVSFLVSNSLQAAFWYCCNFGFARFAEKRTDKFVEIAVKNGKVIFVFKSALRPNVTEIREDIICHGDFIKDIAFMVDDIECVVERISKLGARILSSIQKISDEKGSILSAKVESCCGRLVHTLIQNIDYTGIFIPGYKPTENFKFANSLLSVKLNFIDHIVESHSPGTLDDVAEWYKEALRLKRFWSVDDLYSDKSLIPVKGWLLNDSKRTTQLTIAEPIIKEGVRGQLEEFQEYHGGAGIQHIALNVTNIVDAIGTMKRQGADFLSIPDTYYDQLEERLSKTKLKIEENLKEIRRLKILMDFDEKGYLLQIFTKPVQDRPTLFIEFIQRRNFDGFGAGNFKALFEAIEEEQRRRNSFFLENKPKI